MNSILIRIGVFPVYFDYLFFTLLRAHADPSEFCTSSQYSSRMTRWSANDLDKVTNEDVVIAAETVKYTCFV